MSREIKFRAWNKQKGLQKMYYLDGFIPYGEGWGNGNPNYKFYELQYGGSGFMKVDAKDIEIMQYTGLIDKNKNQIYEWDIVRILYTDWPSKSKDDNRTLEQYMKDIAEIKTVIWSYNGFYVSHKIDGYAESMAYGAHGYIEIIGNIYENPELLK